MNEKETASAVIKHIGGKENIKNMTHCVTRLRFVLVDETKADIEAVKKVQGVLNVVISGGQHQVVIGPAVESVYKEACKITGNEGNSLESKNPASHDGNLSKEKKTVKSIARQAMDTLIACFVPCIPAIAGAGMIKVIAVLLSFAGLLSNESSTYIILNTIGDGIFYFLPFFAAYNAAKKMNVDIYLAMSLAAIVLHPNLAGLGEAGTSAGFFCFQMSIMDYSAQALPMVFGVWLLKYADRLADKISPKLVKVFLRPLIALLITAPVVLIVIGPAALTVSGWLFTLCQYMQNWGWIAVAINAALFPLMVLTGTHNATIPLIIQMFATQGFDAIFLPCGLAANIAEAGAAFAVSLKTRNKELRQTGLSATLSALLGITEPALYGVNLRMKRPFAAVLAGAFIGGAYIGLIGLTAPAFVTPSLLTIPVFTENCNFILGLSSIPVTFMITFIIAYMAGFQDLPDTMGNNQ